MNYTDKYNLSTCPLFADLSTEELHDFLERAVYEIRTLEKGVHAVRQGDTINNLHLLVSGLVRAEMITNEGNLLEIEFIEAIRPLAPAFIFANNNRFPVDVITMEKCVFYIIKKDVWLAEMRRNEKLLTNFLRLNSNMTVFLSNRVQMMSIKSLKGKLSRYILENTSNQESSFILKRTQTQLAEYFGVQRPSLSRTMNEMIAEGLIVLDKKRLHIVNRQKLETLL